MAIIWTARCRPPVSGALLSHGLTPQYHRPGPGVPPLLWPLTGGRRPPAPGDRVP